MSKEMSNRLDDLYELKISPGINMLRPIQEEAESLKILIIKSIIPIPCNILFYPYLTRKNYL